MHPEPQGWGLLDKLELGVEDPRHKAWESQFEVPLCFGGSGFSVAFGLLALCELKCRLECQVCSYEIDALNTGLIYYGGRRVVLLVSAAGSIHLHRCLLMIALDFSFWPNGHFQSQIPVSLSQGVSACNPDVSKCFASRTCDVPHHL